MEIRSSNPFSPLFGTPRHFFGRTAYVDMMREAMGVGRRPNRSVIIEGVRGTGKTALLSRLCDLAKELDWEAIWAIPQDDARELVASIESLDTHPTRTLPVDLDTPLGGDGSGAGLMLTDSPRNLTEVLINHLEKSGRGLLLLIDEAQRLSESYAQEVCIALNAAREEGLDVALVACGLPGVYHQLSRLERCTFMARSSHRILPMLTISETYQAFRESFDLVPEMDVSSEMIEAMAAFTKGHPYLVQLVGYSLFEQAYRVASDIPWRYFTFPIPATPEMLVEAEYFAWTSYSKNVLDLVIGRYRSGTLDYLRALVATMDANGVMRSDCEVAHALGKECSKELSTYRARLIAAGVIRPLGRGKLAFRIPYIPRYLEEGPALSEEEPGEYFVL